MSHEAPDRCWKTRLTSSRVKTTGSLVGFLARTTSSSPAEVVVEDFFI